MSTKVIDCGGSQIEVSDAAAIAIKALQDKHAAEIEARDGKIQAADAKVAELEKQVATSDAKVEALEKRVADAEAKTTPEALEAAAAARAKLLEDARKLAPELDCKTLDSAGIRRAALEAAGVNLEGKSEAFIDAAFEARVELAGDSPAKRTAKALADAPKSKTTDAGDPRAAYMERTSQAYRREVQA